MNKNKLVKIIALIVCSFTGLAHAQDSRLIGNWILTNSPVTLPPNSLLAIEENPDRYDAYLSFPISLPAPLSCKIPAGQNIVKLFPLGGTSYTIQVFTFEAGSCEDKVFLNTAGTIEFDASGNSFASCDANNLVCLSWKRQGSAPGAIGKTTVPPIVSPVGGKGSISTAFLAVEGATGYRVTIKGPVNLSRTVKKGLFTKFTGLSKGTYKVGYEAFFKDKENKVQSTKSSIAIKVNVT